MVRDVGSSQMPYGDIGGVRSAAASAESGGGGGGVAAAGSRSVRRGGDDCAKIGVDGGVFSGDSCDDVKDFLRA